MYCLEWQLDLDLRRAQTEMKLSSYMEAGDDEPKGILGFIKRGFDAIIKFFSNAFNKIKSFITGKNKNESKNDSSKFQINPKIAAEYADKFIGEDKEMLQKLMSGNASKEEIEALCSRHKQSFDNIKPYIGPVVALASSLLLGGAGLNKWTKDIREAKLNQEDAILDLGKKYNHAKTKADQKNVKQEAVNMILLDMQKCGTYGKNAITDFIKKYYVTREVSKEIQSAADAFDNESSLRDYKNDLKGRRKTIKAESREYDRKRSREEKATKTLNKEQNKNDRVLNKLDRAKFRFDHEGMTPEEFDRQEREHDKTISIAHQRLSSLDPKDRYGNSLHKYDRKGNTKGRNPKYDKSKESNYSRIQKLSDRASRI